MTAYWGKRNRERITNGVRMFRLWCRLWLCLPLIALPACNSLGRQSAPAGALPNLVTVSESIDTAGQPSASQLAALTWKDYQMVINLSPADTRGSVAREEQLLTAKGITYVHIPVDIERLETTEFDLFSAILSHSRAGRTLVHCQSNMRASVFVFLHQVSREEVPAEEAYDRVTEVWVPGEPWLGFMQQVLTRYGKAFTP